MLPSFHTSNHRKTQRLKALIGCAAFLLVVFFALHFTLQKTQIYYSEVTLQTSTALRINFLHEVHATPMQCEATLQTVSKTMLAYCPDCTVIRARCLEKLSPRQALLLSGESVDVPVLRIPKGVVAFNAAGAKTAQQLCDDSASQSNDAFKCISPDPMGFETTLAETSNVSMAFIPTNKTLAGLTFLSLLVSFMVCGLIIWSERWHGRFSHDAVNSGPQKFHSIPVPRIGGLAIASAIGATIFGLQMAGLLSTTSSTGYALLAASAIPAFAGGLSEDLTKKVGVLSRLLLTITAGVLASLLVGATLDHLDVPGLDNLLQYSPLFAIAFTALAVGGVANAINIIDGYNGLVGGYSIIVLAALAWASAQVGDHVVLIASLVMLGAMAGFLVWNWPYGKIFLGDGGAYLLGFWLAELGVLLVVRNPEVSPWFPLVIMAYPIWETLFSMYRRKILRGSATDHPDALHFHQLIYARLARVGVGSKTPSDRTRRNSGVAPYCWLGTALFITPAIVLWDSTPWLQGLTALFVISYVWLYQRLTRWRAPAWMIYRMAKCPPGS